MAALAEAARRHVPLYPMMSATLIGHLAGAKDQQDRGLGAVLLADALWRAIESPSTVGSSMVIVGALDENTAGSVPRMVSSACPTRFGWCC
jgi:hypothetical protein